MVYYATPEWLKETKKAWDADSNNAMLVRLKKIAMCYRILANPSLGIDADLYFIQGLDNGSLVINRFCIRSEGEKMADWILSTTFETWKSILRKKTKFVLAVVHGDVVVETGDKAALIGRVAWAADQWVTNYFNVETAWPDEMSPEEITAYRIKVRNFRKELGV